MLSSGHPQPYQLSLPQDCWTKRVGDFRPRGDSGNVSLPPYSPALPLSELEGTFFYLLTEGETEAQRTQELD